MLPSHQNKLDKGSEQDDGPCGYDVVVVVVVVVVVIVINVINLVIDVCMCV